MESTLPTLRKIQSKTAIRKIFELRAETRRECSSGWQMMVAEEKMVAWPKWRLGGGAKTSFGEDLKSCPLLVISGNFELIFIIFVQFLVVSKQSFFMGKARHATCLAKRPFIFNCDIINQYPKEHSLRISALNSKVY